MRVTWWGHSTLTLEQDGTRLLTDPVLGNRIAHLRRRGGPRPAPDAAVADAALVSHLHADHLDVPSLLALPPDAALVVPRGAAGLLRGRHPALADRCVELVPGGSTVVGTLTVTAVPAAHDGHRGPWSRHRGPALGYVVTGGGAVTGTGPNVWFAGDTGLHPGMSDLGPVDLALVPVGGWGPTLGHGHLDPAGAVEAVRRTGAGAAVPIHYGTFWPVGCDRVRPERFARPGPDFAGLLAGTAAPHVLGHGETLTLAGHRA